MTAAAEVDVDRPVFIVGSGRSGTTLLRTLLGAHGELAVTPETHFLKRVDAEGLLHAEGIDDFEGFWSRYTGAWTFTDLGVEPGRVRALIESESGGGGPTPRGVFRAVLRAYGEAQGKRRVGEKTPGHHAYLGTLFGWFPEARVIEIRRDPRAVVASKLKSPWAKRRATGAGGRGVRGRSLHRAAVHAEEWSAAYERNLPPWRDDPRVCCVSYESLTEDPLEVLRVVCGHVGVGLDDAVRAAAGGAGGAAAPAGEIGDAEMDRFREEHHRLAEAAVNRGSRDKWKEQLTAAEVALVEGWCAAGMAAGGYEPVTPAGRRAAGRAAAAALLGAAAAEGRLSAGVARVRRSGNWHLRRVGRAAARRLPGGWTGHRVVERVTADELSGEGVRRETIHPAAMASNPLPANVASRDELPADAGWWGYAFRDVPERRGGETFLLTVPDARVISHRDPERGDDFYPAVLLDDHRAIDLPQLRWRPGHAAAMRRAGGRVRLDRAVWFMERVYHNHSHWLTAHLPKLLLLRERGLLDRTIFPAERSDALNASLEALGIDPTAFHEHRTGELLEVGELTLVGSDRFRPELLRSVAAAYGVPDAPPPERRVYISRERATRRRLLNEAQVWGLLEPLGFEKVLMEDLSFDEQVALMKQTKALVAPHGAGLSNMLFMPPGGTVTEVADLGFPNPNFYATAAALGLPYRIVRAASVGDGHPLERDLIVDLAAVEAAVRAAIRS